MKQETAQIAASYVVIFSSSPRELRFLNILITSTTPRDGPKQRGYGDKKTAYEETANEKHPMIKRIWHTRK